MKWYRVTQYPQVFDTSLLSKLSILLPKVVFLQVNGWSTGPQGLGELQIFTRPDIAYTVSKLSSYMSNLRANHWKGIMRVLKYLQFTCDYGPHYTRYHVVLEGYSDAN